MADSKLRAVLIYRIDSSSDGATSSTMLAKYDYAADYEAHGGSANEALYGARDGNYAEAVAMMIAKNLPGALTDPSTIGGFKSVQSEIHQVVYGADSSGVCIAVVTGLRYPTRTATQMILLLYKDFKGKFALQAKSGISNSLTNKAKPILRDYCMKFSDAAAVDKAASILQRVDAVKVVMQDNIANMLSNIEKTEAMSEKAEELNEQANVFKKKSTELRKKMACRDFKVTIILAVIVLVVLTIILAPIIVRAQKAVHDYKNPTNSTATNTTDGNVTRFLLL